MGQQMVCLAIIYHYSLLLFHSMWLIHAVVPAPLLELLISHRPNWGSRPWISLLMTTLHSP